jgi:Protein of unknown function (DUF1566)
MKALAHDIRKLLADRIQTASAADLFAIATSICANDEDEAELTTGRAFKPLTAVATDLPRFTRYDLHGAVVQSGGVAIYDAETNLTWTIAPLECGAVPWKDALQACSNFRLFGKDDWRAPTVKERVSIIDYTKVGPALYAEFDAGGAGWEWTSTVDAESPSDCAWYVGLHDGDVGRGYRTGRGDVRAVRAGQPLSLGL